MSTLKCLVQHFHTPIFACAHEETRFKSKILEDELNADDQTTAIFGQISFYFK